MTETKIEFAVQMSGEKCAEEIRKSLKGLGTLEIDLELNRLIIESKLPWIEIQEKIESTGRRAVLSGFGGKSAVAMINGSPTKTINDSANVRGVVRFTTSNNSDSVIIDGVLDGLSANNEYKLCIFECGDLSSGCSNLGDVYGQLGNVQSDDRGRSTFKLKNDGISVLDIVGRSFVVENEKNEADRKCGIIARSAGIFENYKKICACDGVTLWDERDRPMAGKARRQD